MSESKGQVEEILKELGRKIDGLVEEMKEATDEVRERFEKQIENLKARKEKLQREFKDQQKWQEVKTHFVNAAGELRKGLSKVFRNT